MAYALALNQQWQDKLIVEIDKAYEKHGKLGNDAIREMKITDAVASETLRMYPPALMPGRVATADYKFGDTGIVVTKGMNPTLRNAL
ncbi:cytochrome P450 6B7-like [Parasteatoda tepidariorum]|uniref:cytochrome P450 6B7-like n=1 Tax=Parasteatoda tepidariorum TaxID=114398 RepID=UPI0039BD8E0C